MRTKTQDVKSVKIMEALKVGKDGCFKNPSLAKPLDVVFDDTVSTHVTIDGLSSQLSINTRNPLIEVIIFDVYAAIASHIVSEKDKKEAGRWLDVHYSDLPLGLKYRCSFQMACDKYAIEQTCYKGPTDVIIPFVTMSDISNGIYSENLIEMELKNMNHLVLIRRQYAMEIIADLHKEKNNGKKKFSAKELKAMEKNSMRSPRMLDTPQRIQNKRPNKTHWFAVAEVSD